MLSRQLCGFIAGLALIGSLAAAPAPGPLQGAEGCGSLLPAIMGGPIPTDRNLILLRWLSTANYELVYHGHVYVLDAYFDRGPRNRSTGVVPSQVRRADAIFIGHAHFDHMSDAVPIAQRMRAPVYGAKITIDTARRLGLPPELGHPVGDGDALRFPEMRVDTALARHSTLKPEVLQGLGKLFELDGRAATPDDLNVENGIRAKGSFAPEVITQGTIAYAFTFDTGFKLLWLDSAGPVTDGDRTLAQRLGPVDIAIIAYQGHPVAETQVPVTLELTKLFRPRIFLPSHHDEIFGAFVDLGVEPLFEAIQEALPGTQTIAPLHRRPMCFDIRK